MRQGLTVQPHVGWYCVDQAGPELTEICVPLFSECWVTQHLLPPLLTFLLHLLYCLPEAPPLCRPYLDFTGSENFFQGWLWESLPGSSREVSLVSPLAIYVINFSMSSLLLDNPRCRSW